MADPWAAYPDADEAADPWAGFPDADPAKPRETKAGNPAPKPGTITGALDGDTLATTAATLRLWGIDAPELNQRGYQPDGSTVPVGEQSRNSLLELIHNPLGLRVGPSAGTSYGRTV